MDILVGSEFDARAVVGDGCGDRPGEQDRRIFVSFFQGQKTEAVAAGGGVVVGIGGADAVVVFGTRLEVGQLNDVNECAVHGVHLLSIGGRRAVINGRVR